MSDLPEGYAHSPRMTASRVGKLAYRAGNGRGDSIIVGTANVPGAFTPGELLKIALATCNALSAEHRLSHALGDDFEADVMIDTIKNEVEERYEEFTVTLRVPLSDLDASTRERVDERVPAAVERWCTIGRTVLHPSVYSFHLEDTSSPES